VGSILPQQHKNSLLIYPVIDVIVRNEGEQTLTEMVNAKLNNLSFTKTFKASLIAAAKNIIQPSSAFT
jgi:hypothetical protein